MTSEDLREINHFLSGRYPSLLRGTQERLIERLLEVESRMEQYREAARDLLNFERKSALDELTALGQAMGDYDTASVPDDGAIRFNTLPAYQSWVIGSHD